MIKRSSWPWIALETKTSQNTQNLFSNFKHCKPLPWSAFWSLEKIWHSHSIPTHTKLGIFKTTCLSVLLYGSETWVFTKDIISKLNAFATSCYRIILGIKRLDKVPNEILYILTGTSPLITTVKSRQLKFLGHILRMENNEPANLCIVPATAQKIPRWPDHSPDKCRTGSILLAASHRLTPFEPPWMGMVGNTLQSPVQQQTDDDDYLPICKQ